MGEPNSGLLGPSLRHPGARASHHDVEVHTEDTDTGVVSGTQIDVLLDTETEVSSLREVSAAQLVLLDLQATLQDLLSLGATDGNVDGDLFVPSNTECSDGVAGFRGDGGLTGELFEDLGGTGEAITRFTNGDVCDDLDEQWRLDEWERGARRTDHELVDAELTHGVGGRRFFGLSRT